jgi:hypothetical protein
VIRPERFVAIFSGELSRAEKRAAVKKLERWYSRFR